MFDIEFVTARHGKGDVSQPGFEIAAGKCNPPFKIVFDVR